MKIWAYVALATILIAGIGAAFKATYTAGWNARDVEVLREKDELRSEVRRVEQERWAAAVKASQDNIKIEERIDVQIREVEKMVPKIVEKIVQVTPECRDLGDDFTGVLNNHISIANTGGLPSVDGDSGLDGEVP